MRPDMPTASDLSSHLGYWLRYVSNHVSHAFALKLGSCDATVAEWAILRELYGDDHRAPSHVAQKLGLTRGAISKLADRLIAKGLATRTASASDGRAQTLALTAGGRRLVPKLAALADRNDAEFFGHLGPKQRSAVERILKEIVRIRGLKSTPID